MNAIRKHISMEKEESVSLSNKKKLISHIKQKYLKQIFENFAI